MEYPTNGSQPQKRKNRFANEEIEAYATKKIIVNHQDESIRTQINVPFAYPTASSKSA